MARARYPGRVQARKNLSFIHEIAQGWAETLEEHIRHMVMRFDSVKLFETLFNECFPSGDSVALAYQAELGETSNAP